MFEDLALQRELRLGLEAMALESPTQVQAQAVPACLDGHDLLVSAETGSGKTLAYLIPVAQKILQHQQQRSVGTLALVLVPTRELTRQVVKHARALLMRSHVKVQGITGGADTRYQLSLLRKDPEIVIATPGRLLELCKTGGAKLDALQTLVIDEADRMLDMGFRDDVLAIAGLAPTNAQVLLTSATLKHRGVESIAGHLLKQPKHISVGTARQPHSTIHHQMILADGVEHKDKLLPALLQQGGFTRALVFANKRRTATRLGGLLSHLGMRSAALHGELSTEERKAVIEQFQSGKVQVVCASDLAARGLDIANIDLVVNYDVPHSGEDYLHRTGRTGRAGAEGLAVSLVSAIEWNNNISIQRYLKLSFERRQLGGLKARFSGPKKQKSSGKAAGPKKKKTRKPEEKRSSRSRHLKNKGKPRSTSGATSNDGFAPPKKRKPPQA